MLFQDIIQKPSPVPHVCQIVKGRMVKFTTAESKPRWGSTWGLVTSSSPYQASLRAYLWLTLCASWHPDPEVGVRDGSTWAIGLQPTQGSLQEFKLLQEVLLPEGAGVHWQEGEQADDEFCLHGEPCLHGRDHPEEKSSWCHRRHPLVSLILTILIHWQLTDWHEARGLDPDPKILIEDLCKLWGHLRDGYRILISALCNGAETRASLTHSWLFRQSLSGQGDAD